MSPRAFHVGRLVEDLVAERQRLIAAEHQRAGLAFADFGCLGFGEDRSDIFRRDAFQRRLERPLVDLSRHRLDIEAGIDEHRLAVRTARSEDDFFGHGFFALSFRHRY
ncbi:hypothetical protein AJ88_01170 [Mesorhizobium amorphae CCBAU 01583]|nr:hypothetical protein AJ88_01170 [Mesorhizobium amorphae CCBAU 01583]